MNIQVCNYITSGGDVFLIRKFDHLPENRGDLYRSGRGGGVTTKS